MGLVSLLSVLACNSVAVPLSAAFPASELRYILDNSGSTTLLASEKFRTKADEVIATGLDHEVNILNVPKRTKGDSTGLSIQLEERSVASGGIMLYTSGTTSRPVRA
jgi:malonyl-CoA/methylmalonyl-CoA synthetase